MQFSKGNLEKALAALKGKHSTLPETPPSTPTRPKTEWEYALDKIQSEIGNNTFSWIQKNEALCINLLICSQVLLTQTIKQDAPIKFLKALLPSIDKYKEYSFIIAPAAKAYEGILFRFMISCGETSEQELEKKFASIGEFYKDIPGKGPARAKNHVKGKNKGVIDKLYGDWQVFRNKVLHFDKEFLVETPNEAKKIVENIFASIKLAYKVFIGKPS